MIASPTNLNITDPTILSCVMNKIIQNYNNPQKYIELSDSDAQSITTNFLNGCSNSPNPNANRKPGEQFADTCIQDNAPGYGKCMPSTVEECANKMCDIRYKSSRGVDRQTCYDDAAVWANNNCKSIGPDNPPPYNPPGQDKPYAYCGRDKNPDGSDCGCQHSETKPPGLSEYSLTCSTPCSYKHCKYNESFHGVH
jgi:hypothetical protein